MLLERFVIITLLLLSINLCFAQQPTVRGMRIISFFSGKSDQAHISFVNEANQWFDSVANINQFSYDTCSDWTLLNDSALSHCDLIIFLDSRPPSPDTRKQFERYMKNGGSWIGFHFAAFALTPSAYPQDWNWYHNEFLGSGQYKSNTWRPTAAKLKIELKHAVTKGLPPDFLSQPNEWYRWEKDLRLNKDIDIILSIHPGSFPLGTGPKPHEIWHEGYYPVVWTNKNYHMIYFNMGHNDIDYEGGSLQTLSNTFGNPVQDQMIVNAITWLTEKKMPQQ